MGKRIIQQARGKGGPRYRSPGHHYTSDVKYINSNLELKGRIVDLTHCAAHSSPIAKVKYENNKEGYIFAPLGIYIGQDVYYNNKEIKPGNVISLKNIPEGTDIFNIECDPGDGGRLVRAAGTSAKLLNKLEKGILVKLPSKKQKIFHPECKATIGILAGGGRKEKPILTAGHAFYAKKARNKLYPRVRAGAMNATDHPFGSGRHGPKFGGRASSIAPKFAPPGRKVGLLRPRKTGRGK